MADGADALAAAGGDGTQALVASIAAEHDLPFACIPAGTRNHFALDLGVDRDDVVGALDAFVAGGERRVDLAEVNGRTFVNNVSLGLYAEAVQREGYRDAKLRTILDTVPDVMGTDGSRAPALRWTGPEGTAHDSAAVILVSNNVYRLGRAIGSGTRPRIDDGAAGHRGDGGSGSRRPAEQPARALAPVVRAELRGGLRGAGPGRRGRRGARRSSPRCASPSVPACCGCGSPRTTPAPHRRRRCPTGLWDGIRALLRIAAGGRSPQAERADHMSDKKKRRQGPTTAGRSSPG